MAFDNCPFDITPLDQSQPITTAPINNLNYTNQDFWSMKSRLIDFIGQQFGDKFNDLVEGDLAIMLIETWAFLADTVSFKIDQIANEIFIDTVTEVENAFRLSRLVGFRPQPPIAARSLWQGTINGVQNADLHIPPGLILNVTGSQNNTTIELFAADSDNNPVFDQDIIISAGTLQNTSIVGLEGRTFTDSYTGTGEIAQTLQTTVNPVIWNSVQVEVDGVKWREVDYFTDSNPRQEYRVEFDSSFNAYVIFGNNRAGLIPSRGSSVRITYRQGGGVNGNIITGAVEAQRTFTIPGIDVPIPVTFKNYTRGEFGYDGDQIDDIRRKLPAYLRTQNRCVTGGDYKTLADQFATPYSGQIGKSTAVLRNYGCAANIIDLYVLARIDGTTLDIAAPELKAALQEQINSQKMLTDFVCIRDGVVLSVDVAIDLVLDKFYRKFEDENRVKVQRRVDQFFDINSWEYGQTLKDIGLVKAISDLKQINQIEITFTSDDPNNSGQVVSSRFYELIRPDTVTINFLYE